MLQFYQEEDYANTLRVSPFNNEPKIRHVPHNKVCLLCIFENKFGILIFFVARINSKTSSLRKSCEIY
jgi:hypothetical protein